LHRFFIALGHGSKCRRLGAALSPHTSHVSVGWQWANSSSPWSWLKNWRTLRAPRGWGTRQQADFTLTHGVVAGAGPLLVPHECNIDETEAPHHRELEGLRDVGVPDVPGVPPPRAPPGTAQIWCPSCASCPRCPSPWSVAPVSRPPQWSVATAPGAWLPFRILPSGAWLQPLERGSRFTASPVERGSGPWSVALAASPVERGSSPWIRGFFVSPL